MSLVENGVNLIAVERVRQVAELGYTAKHDRAHHDQSLAMAAVAYAIPNRTAEQAVNWWPWAAWANAPVVHHNVHNVRGRQARIRELAKAGALIAAEIDRLLEATQ